VATILLIDNTSYAQSLNQAALIVQYGDGTVFTHCVDFVEEHITGLDVLQRAGLDLVYASGGAGSEICKIGPDGCDDPTDCWCQCKGKDCRYWSYWHLVDGAWRYSPLGASLYKVKDGAVEGWVWGIGTPTDAPQPPAVTFEEICIPLSPTPKPTDTPPSTATLLPTATQPPQVEATPTASLTPAPAATATATPVPATPTPEPAPQATQGTGWGSYAAFGGIAVILAVIGLVVLKKR
jgi:hypothetical protein